MSSETSLPEEVIVERQKRIQLLEKKQRLREGLPHLYGWNWYSWAREFFESRNKVTLLVAGNQLSKDLHVDTEIPTPKGFIRMGDLKLGDEVFAQDGTVTKIIDIPYEGTGPGYKITFTDGSEVICGPHHEWVAKSSRERFRKTYESKYRESWDNPTYNQWKIFETKEMALKYSPGVKNNKDKFSIPICAPVEYETKPLYLKPYLMGLLLGDGCFSASTGQVGLTTGDKEIIESVSEETVGISSKQGTSAVTVRLVQNIKSILKHYDLHGKLSDSKFIPRDYLESSVQHRISLLQGLMDTDGSVTSTGICSFTTVSPQLAKDVRELVTSLGGSVTTRIRKTGYKKNGELIPCKDAYHLRLKVAFNPFKLERKRIHFVPSDTIKYRFERVIERIEPLEKIQSKCITVEHSSSTFLCTRDFIVTHNSSSQIRKCIHWATDKELWPLLWRSRPRVFIYMYPSLDVALNEFETKWVPEFMPAGEFEKDAKYGWTFDKKRMVIQFNSGVMVMFKSYEQDKKNLQTVTAHAVFVDEEIPVEIYDEIMFRIAATDGYFSMVFTATLGQDFWRRAMERQGFDDEVLPQAHKIQVSAYDCLTYEDGTASFWTEERIERLIAQCKSQNEVLKRIHGRFVVDEGLKYAGYDRDRNRTPATPIPDGWLHYAAVDIGSGGKGHPAAIAFIAVRPDMRYGRIYKAWRGVGVDTKSSDILTKFLQMRGATKFQRQAYDYAGKDFFLSASRIGKPFEPAAKSHEMGEQTLNALFKNGMLTIDEGDPELDKLEIELLTVVHNKDKRKLKDDLCDATRYCVMLIAWDWSAIGEHAHREIQKEGPTGGVDELLRSGRLSEDEYLSRQQTSEISAEFEEWNTAYGN